MRWLRASNGSGGQLGATLAAAITEDRTAGAGAHAEAEAVLLGATTVVRLESTLAHGAVLNWIESCDSEIWAVRRPPLAHVKHDMGTRRVSFSDD
jgi:hypothetical protein